MIGVVFMQPSRRIFVIDDEPNIRNFLSRALDVKGFEVVAFSDAESFLNSAEIDNYALGLIDLNLPAKHGASVADFLRQRKINIPLIAMSGFIGSSTDSRTWDKDTLLDCGFTDTMEKPIGLAKLYKKIETYI